MISLSGLTLPLWLLIGLNIACTAPSAAARSKAADWLVQEQIAEGCGNNRPGRFAPSALIERDLTGDGKKDLIISHDGLTCGSGARSSFCGMRTCTVILYVREGDLLRKSKDVLSIGVTVGAGNPPAIELIGNDFQERTMRWDGRAFGVE